MRKQVFVTGSNVLAAQHVACLIMMNHHEVTSRWHEQPFKHKSLMSGMDKEKLANEQIHFARTSDVTVILADSHKVAGGKFVVAGAALGAGKQVILLGDRENLLMWHSSVVSVDTVQELLKELGDAFDAVPRR